MTYRKKCPHCKCMVENGHGEPFKHLGNPIKICPHCHRSYIDMDVIEWEYSPIYRKISYYFANNRIWICLIPSMLVGALTPGTIQISLLFAFLTFAFIFFLCSLYVKVKIKKEIPQSQKRLQNKDYVRFLQNSEYPAKKHYIK